MTEEQERAAKFSNLFWPGTNSIGFALAAAALALAAALAAPGPAGVRVLAFGCVLAGMLASIFRWGAGSVARSRSEYRLKNGENSSGPGFLYCLIVLQALTVVAAFFLAASAVVVGFRVGSSSELSLDAGLRVRLDSYRKAIYAGDDAKIRAEAQNLVSYCSFNLVDDRATNAFKGVCTSLRSNSTPSVADLDRLSNRLKGIP